MVLFLNSFFFLLFFLQYVFFMSLGILLKATVRSLLLSPAFALRGVRVYELYSEYGSCFPVSLCLGEILDVMNERL